jgi:hypothetical protein
MAPNGMAIDVRHGTLMRLRSAAIYPWRTGLTTATRGTTTVADLRLRRGLAKAAIASQLGQSAAGWDSNGRGQRRPDHLVVRGLSP